MNVNPIPFDAASVWPEPDMTVMRPTRAVAPTMTRDDFSAVFGGWTDWLHIAAEVKGAPVDYVALALLCTSSAIIGNTRWAVPWDGWKEPPILWGMLIGDPSAGKSPALDAILDPVRAIDAEFAQEYKEQRKKWAGQDEVSRIVLGQWKADAKAAIAEGNEAPTKPGSADAGAPPIRKRIRITDATTESVADLLSGTWRGLLLSRDELSGWLGSMDRYSGGGDRPFWLEAFGGRTYSVDRKGKPEPIIVEHLSVCILGGTQPDKLDSMLVNSDDDGLTARFLTVYPEQVPLRRPSATLDETFATDAMKRLHSLQPAFDEHGAARPFFVHLDEDAAQALQEFRVQCREWENDASGLMKSHIGKLSGIAVRVALVLAHLDWAAGPNNDAVGVITASHIGRACHYVGEHLRGHAHRAYGAASVPNDVRNARRIADVILKEQVTRITARQIQRRQWKGLQNVASIRAAFAVLIDADWVQEGQEETKGKPRKFYAVNPRLGAANE